MNILGKVLATAVGTTLLAGSANAACMSEAAYKAAQIRELDTMLMVEALRCRMTAATFLETYNEFVVTSRPALIRANATLRGHFTAHFGERQSLNAFDNYMTTVANRYGAGTDGLKCEDMASITRAALAANGSHDDLHQVAVTAQMIPSGGHPRCDDAGLTTVTMVTEP